MLWTQAGNITAVERRFLSPDRPEEPPIGAGPVRFLCLPADCILVEALRAMKAQDAQVILVSKDPAGGRAADVVGVVTAAELAGAMQSGAEMM